MVMLASFFSLHGSHWHLLVVASQLANLRIDYKPKIEPVNTFYCQFLPFYEFLVPAIGYLMLW